MAHSPSQRVMRRRAADNPYFHRDFHGVLSAGLDYLERQYGVEAVLAFLRRFVHQYHAPLRAALVAEGLRPLREYLERIYLLEGAEFTWDELPESLTITLSGHPALAYLRQNGYAIAPSFLETTRYLYEALCEDTPWAFEFQELDSPTGAYRLRFFRRLSP